MHFETERLPARPPRLSQNGWLILKQIVKSFHLTLISLGPKRQRGDKTSQENGRDDEQMRQGGPEAGPCGPLRVGEMCLKRADGGRQRLLVSMGPAGHANGRGRPLRPLRETRKSPLSVN